MAEIRYLDQRRDGGMFDYISNSMKSPFISNTVDTKKKKDIDSVSFVNQAESRDDVSNVMLLNIPSSASGESLAFDATKVYNMSRPRPRPPHSPARQDSSDEEQREGSDGILSKASLVNPPTEENEVYTGMSKRYREILRDDDWIDNKKADDSRVGRAMKLHRPKPSTTNNKKNNRVSWSSSTIPAVSIELPITSRWKKESQAAALAKAINREITELPVRQNNNKPSLPPPKYSVSNIYERRAKPAPKSDDFFAELQKWHNDYSLRQVDKPHQITVTTKEPIVTFKEDEQEQEHGMEIDDAKTEENKGTEKKRRTFWRRISQKQKKKDGAFDIKDDNQNQGIEVTSSEETTNRGNKREQVEAKPTKAVLKKEAKKAAADAKKAKKEERKAALQKKRKAAFQKKKEARRRSNDAKNNIRSGSSEGRIVVPVIESTNDDGSIEQMSFAGHPTNDTKERKKMFKLPSFKRKQKETEIVEKIETAKQTEIAGEIETVSQTEIAEKIETVEEIEALEQTETVDQTETVKPTSSSNSVVVDDESNTSPQSDSTRYPALGMSQQPKKVPMKLPHESFHDTLGKFLMREVEARNERIATDSEGSVEQQNNDDVEGTSSKRPDPEESKSIQSEESTPELKKTDSWLEKAAALFNTGEQAAKSAAVTEVIEEENPIEPSEFAKGDENGELEDALIEERASQSDSVAELKQKDSWLEKATGFFKKEDKAIEPVERTETDRSEQSIKPEGTENNDKIELAESTKEEEKVEGEVDLLIEAKPSQSEPVPDLKQNAPSIDPASGEGRTNDYETAKSIEDDDESENYPAIEVILDDTTVTSEDEESGPTEAPTEEDAEEDGAFLDSTCPCMGRKQLHEQINIDGDSRTESKPESKQKELSWFQMATGYFTPTGPAEAANNAGDVETNPKKNLSQRLLPDIPELTTNDDGTTRSGSEHSSVRQRQSVPSKAGGDGDDSKESDAERRHSLPLIVLKSDSLCESRITVDGETTAVQETDPASAVEDGLGLLDPEASKTDIAGSVESEKLETGPAHEEETPCVAGRESPSRADSEPKASASGSLSCANSKQSRGSAKDKNEKSSAATRTAKPASLCGGSQSPNTESASCLDSKTPEDSKSRDDEEEGSEGFAKPTEMIFLKGKNNSIKHGAQPSKQAGSKSKKQKESKNDLVEEDAENSNRHGNQKSRPTKQQKGGKSKSRRGKGKEKKQKATTLFGRLEPESNSDSKKQKFKRKKAKLSQSLF